jgi:CHAD domain-containing protein
MREVELKLAVPGSFVMPPLFNDRLGITEVDELPELDMRTTYYDTADLRLARSGVTLRYRTGEEGGARWTLKLPVLGEGMTIRDEQHFSGAPHRVPADAQDLVTAYVRAAPLASVASIRTRRHRWLLKTADAAELAEVVDDEVSVVDDGQVVGRFRELEVEARLLDKKGIERVAALLTEAGAMASEPIPKFVRALGSKATAPADVPRELDVSPSAPAGRAVQAALAADLARLIAHDPGVRLGVDDEAVHQMRVATRRLRSDMRTFAPLIEPEWAGPIVDELKWLGKALGAVRDVDVLIEEFERSGADFRDSLDPLFDHLTARRAAARDALVADLRSDRYKALLDRLVEAVAAPAFTPRSQRACAEELPVLVAGAWRNLARAGRGLRETDSDKTWHKVRIRAKRARYAAEAVAPALASSNSKDATRFAKACAKVQGVLGELQDAVVAIGVIDEIASAHPRSGRLNVALGRLIERQATRRGRARARFPKAWKKLDSEKNLRWLPS